MQIVTQRIYIKHTQQEKLTKNRKYEKKYVVRYHTPKSDRAAMRVAGSYADAKVKISFLPHITFTPRQAADNRSVLQHQLNHPTIFLPQKRKNMVQ